MKKLKLKALELGASEVLTRDQMKNVMRSTVGGTASCSTSSCSVFDGSNTYYGTCGMFGGYNPPCLCVTSYGSYTPTSGTSHCA